MRRSRKREYNQRAQPSYSVSAASPATFSAAHRRRRSAASISPRRRRVVSNRSTADSAIVVLDRANHRTTRLVGNDRGLPINRSDAALPAPTLDGHGDGGSVASAHATVSADTALGEDARDGDGGAPSPRGRWRSLPVRALVGRRGLTKIRPH